jgi:hypothetical protein
VVKGRIRVGDFSILNRHVIFQIDFFYDHTKCPSTGQGVGLGKRDTVVPGLRSKTQFLLTGLSEGLAWCAALCCNVVLIKHKA